MDTSIAVDHLRGVQPAAQLLHRRAYGRIDDADYMIAATAIVLDVELLTLNVRHFPMLTGLQPAY